MTLPAAAHQKISALQQVARLVPQAQSVAGNQQVLTNIANNLLPLIEQWQRSDPEFAELAQWLRQARVDPSPHVLTNIAGQAQRMIALVRGGQPYRTNRAGDRVIWDPKYGNITSPVLEEDEPITPMSPYGWRGSKKYPFGKGFPDYLSIEGFDFGEFPLTKGNIPLNNFIMLVSASLLAIHGYERNKSVQSAIAWGVLGGTFWPIGLLVMYMQGFRKRS